ncbi:DUF3533 domain-containing protein [Gordonia oryzae]|nr:DUF3533 domain-containing protein [Gordonia oryzae]
MSETANPTTSSDDSSAELPSDDTSPFPPDPRSPKKVFLGALIFPIFMMVVMPLLYSWGLHSPTPHDMKVAIIGDTSTSQQVASAITTQSDGSFAVSTVADPGAARAAIDNLAIRGAWNPATNDIYVASAGGPIASNTAESFLSAVAKKQNPDRPVNVIDVIPPNGNDKLANSLLFVGLAAVLGGFSFASALRIAVGGLSLRVELILLAVFGALLTTIPTFIAYSVYGSLDSGFIKAALLAYAGLLTVGCFHLGSMRLIGPLAIIPTVFIMVLMGIPASGAAIPAEMVPGFLGTMNRILPTPALLDGLRRLIYFPDAGMGATLSTLALWALLGMVMIALAAMRHSAKPEENSLQGPGFQHFFGDNREVTAAQHARRKALAGAAVVPIFLVTCLPLTFIGLFHNPTPHEMKVAIVGTDQAVTQQLTTQLEKVTGNGFDFTSVPDADTARNQLHQLEIRGAYDPATATLTIAGAGNLQATQVVKQTFGPVAASSGKTLQVDDIAPLPTSDLVGAGVLYLGLGAILGGYLSAMIAYMLGRGLGLRWQVGAIVVISAVCALAQVLISYQWIGILHHNEIAVAATLFVIALTCGLFQLGGSMLIGPLMMVVSMLVLIFLGVSSSGIAVGTDMAPAFYRVLHPILPTSNGFEALKRIAYFDGADAWSKNLWILVLWLAVSAAMVVGGVLLKRAGRGPTPPPINMEPEQ